MYYKILFNKIAKSDLQSNIQFILHLYSSVLGLKREIIKLKPNKQLLNSENKTLPKWIWILIYLEDFQWNYKL